MVNVIIPAYNCSKTLHRTLSSLSSQTDPNFIVTIIDDCSTENLLPIIEKFKDLNINVIRHEKNLGCGMSRQTGIDNNICEYFCFLDSDDIFMPYTIAVFNDVVRKNKNVEYVSGWFLEEKDDGTYIINDIGCSQCHAKLYNASKISEFDIRNISTIRWADDSFFNSMVSELMTETSVELPLYIWTNNKESVTRIKSKERSEKCLEDFLEAMIFSVEHVLKYKDKVDHLSNTLEIVRRSELNEKTEELYFKLRNYLEGSDKNGDDS